MNEDPSPSTDPVRLPTRSAGIQQIDLTKALQIAGELEDEHILRSMGIDAPPAVADARLPDVIIDGPSVRLRPVRQDDAADVMDAIDAEILRWLPLLPDPYSAEDARFFCSEFAPQLQGQDFSRVELRAAVGNLASQQVAERAGFRREGVLRHAGLTRSAGPTDLVVFSRLRTDTAEAG